MTIKWVQQDPLVMNGEPFCYNSRLTVRQLLELRSNGYDLTRILTDHPELRVVGGGGGHAARAVPAAGDRREIHGAAGLICAAGNSDPGGRITPI